MKKKTGDKVITKPMVLCDADIKGGEFSPLFHPSDGITAYCSFKKIIIEGPVMIGLCTLYKVKGSLKIPDKNCHYPIIYSSIIDNCEIFDGYMMPVDFNVVVPEKKKK